MLALSLVLTVGVLLAMRRQAPAMTVAGVWAATILLLLLGYFPVSTTLLAPVVASYSAGAYGERNRAAVAAALATASVAGVLLLSIAGTTDIRFAEASAVLLLLACAGVVGDRVRTRRQLLAGLQEQVRLQERERAAMGQLAAAAERARIARELHDIVAHGVSVIVVHARGAQVAFDKNPDAARRSLALIETTGREALSELRTVVGALHEGGAEGSGTGERGPQPGLGDLERLVQSTAAAGLAVGLRTEGTPTPVSAAVGLSAYRIVQEALANVLKHSTATSADVVVTHGPDRLVVHVLDAGEPVPDAPASGGHGLVGMRQRVGLLGGRLDVGPRAGGGFEVLAVLPLTRTDP